MPAVQPNVVSIATPEERAWEQLRSMIARSLQDPDEALWPLVSKLREEFISACGE